MNFKREGRGEEFERVHPFIQISIINGGFDILPLPGAVKSIEESRGPTY